MSLVPYLLYLLEFPLERGKKGASFGFHESGEGRRELFLCPMLEDVSLPRFLVGRWGGRQHGGSRCWALHPLLLLGSLWVLLSANSNMPPNTSICPSAQVLAAPHWGIIGLGQVGDCPLEGELKCSLGGAFTYSHPCEFLAWQIWGAHSLKWLSQHCLLSS